MVYGSPERAYEALNLAGAKRASVLVCDFEEDTDNLLVAMNARKINPKIRILLASHDRTIAQSIQPSDVDLILPIMDIASQIMAQAAYSPEVVGVSLKKHPESGEYPFYSEFTVEDGGFTVSQVSEVAPVAMLVRGGELILNPPDNSKVERGDTLYVYTKTLSEIERLYEFLGKKPSGRVRA